MNTIALARRMDLDVLATTALKAAARFWFVVAVFGQLIFAVAIASFYGLTALRGDYHGWSKFISHGVVPGDTMGNFAIAAHLASAVVVILAGALQLVPQVRTRFPVFHRWNGRIYLLTAVTLSTGGLYMLFFRSAQTGGLISEIGFVINIVLIWACAAMALRYAIAGDLRTHRRWALRLFLVVMGAWFFRIGLFLTLLVFGPVGFDPTTFTGPLLTFLGFAQYLVPLAVLELYLRAQSSGSSIQRVAVAGGLSVLTVAMAAGIFAVSMAAWVPEVKAGFDPRISIAETLSLTIASQGIDRAATQYQQLKSADPATYNFDEGELNTLGYRLIGAKQLKEAVRILQLNTEAYPSSSNAFDSLGEAYLDAGDKARAIASYRMAVKLNPHNAGAASMVEKLSAD